MKAVFTIAKKELYRFFKDKRLLISVLIPGLIIYVTYSIMGGFMQNLFGPDNGYKPTLYIVNQPLNIQSVNEGISACFEIKETPSCEQAKQDLKDEKVDLYVVFPEFLPQTSPENSVEISVYYNSASTNSSTAYSMMMSIIEAYRTDVSKISVNGWNDEAYDVADSESVSKMILSIVVPIVLLMLLFSGCMAVAPESIAGEKERGTMATLLVTPVKRSSVAVGKIVALSVIALLSGLSSTLGLLFSLPKLTGGVADMSFTMYGIGAYVEILAVILSTVLILVSLISIISAYAKSVKEANGMVMPIMLVTLLCGISSMLIKDGGSIGLYFIPVLNSALIISGVLSASVSALAVVITVVVNLAVSVLLAFVLSAFFKSEKIMFSR